VVTGALALTSVILALTGAGRESPSEPAVAITPVPGGAMAVANFSLEGL